MTTFATALQTIAAHILTHAGSRHFIPDGHLRLMRETEATLRAWAAERGPVLEKAPGGWNITQNTVL